MIMFGHVAFALTGKNQMSVHISVDFLARLFNVFCYRDAS